MAKNYFIADHRDLSDLVSKLIIWFKERSYDIEYREIDYGYLIQAKKTGFLRTITGTNLAFKVKIGYSTDLYNNQEFIIESSTGKWISNLAGAGFASMFTGGLTIATGIAGAGWALAVEHEMINYIKNELNYQPVKQESGLENNSNSGENSQYIQELKKLELAYKEGVLTEEEFETKKAAISKKIADVELELAIEEQLLKLEKAYVEGILTETEYEAKLLNVRQIAIATINQKHDEAKNEYIAKLQSALENGILSIDEYNAKLSAYS